MGKKIPKAFLLTLSLIISIHIIELFVLPINFFTFRVWEALRVKKFHSLLPGPFYPNMTISMLEEGDLGHHTKLAVKKKVQRITDKYGYRNENENVDRYDIVVIGDSVTVGSSLTQEDMFSNQLEKRLDIQVYPLAPTNINGFLNDPRFKNNPPKIIILETMERYIPNFLPDILINSDVTSKSSGIKSSIKALVKKNQWLVIFCDRINKRIMHEYFTKALSRAEQKLTEKILSLFEKAQNETQSKATEKMIFFDPNGPISQKKMDEVVVRLKSYKLELNKRGIRFIFLALPDKKNTYWQRAQAKEKPIFLTQLMPRLKREGIEAIDVQSVFDKASKDSDKLLYQTDDTHWNPYGVKLVVDLTVKILKGSK